METCNDEKIVIEPVSRVPQGIMWRTIVLAMALLGGCGQPSEGPPTFPAKGVLMIDGEPAVGAQVILHPANGVDFDERGARPTGRVAADGTFELTTYQPGDGAPAGQYVVTMYWAQNPEALEPSPDRLKGMFVNPDESKIEIEITDSSSELPPLELSTKK